VEEAFSSSNTRCLAVIYPERNDQYFLPGFHFFLTEFDFHKNLAITSTATLLPTRLLQAHGAADPENVATTIGQQFCYHMYGEEKICEFSP
jgi:hypothetical protein